MSQRNLYRRIKRLGNGAGSADPALPFRAVSHLNARFSEGNVEALLKGLKAEGFNPDVIIVRPCGMLLGSRNLESEATDVSDLWHNVSPILSAGKRRPSSSLITCGSQVLWVCRPSRNRASGSTDIMAGADNAFSVARKHGGEVITVTCEKCRTAVVLAGTATPMRQRSPPAHLGVDRDAHPDAHGHSDRTFTRSFPTPGFAMRWRNWRGTSRARPAGVPRARRICT